MKLITKELALRNTHEPITFIFYTTFYITLITNYSESEQSFISYITKATWALANLLYYLALGCSWPINSIRYKVWRALANLDQALKSFLRRNSEILRKSPLNKVEAQFVGSWPTENVACTSLHILPNQIYHLLLRLLFNWKKN